MADKKNFSTEAQRGPLMRLSYAKSLRVGKMNDRGVEKFGCTLILPKSDVEGYRQLRNMVAAAIMGEWGDKGVERSKAGLIKNPILPGDGKEARSKESGDLHPGMGPEVVFIRPSSTRIVPVYNKLVLPAADDEVQSGFWGYAALNVFAWHNAQNGDGVSFGINGFQMVKEDEVLGGGGAFNPGGFFERVETSGGGGSVGAGGAGDMFG